VPAVDVSQQMRAAPHVSSASDPILRYLLAAKQAEAEGNPMSAANSVRLALSLDPENPKLQARMKELDDRVDTAMADKFEIQARERERNHEWSEAARLYGRAARGKSSWELFQLAAECALKTNHELRAAGDFAKRAVALAPENAKLRLFLAQIYEQAGMQASALSELDKAQQLNPEDDTINSWLKRLKRGDV
jgi:tetratricopeptide (TPR) repeat protein